MRKRSSSISEASAAGMAFVGGLASKSPPLRSPRYRPCQKQNNPTSPPKISPKDGASLANVFRKNQIKSSPLSAGADPTLVSPKPIRQNEVEASGFVQTGLIDGTFSDVIRISLPHQIELGAAKVNGDNQI